MKSEWAGKIPTEFAALRAKTWSYLIDDGDKKAKATKKCHKTKNKLQYYKYCPESTQFQNEVNYLKDKLDVYNLWGNH